MTNNTIEAVAYTDGQLDTNLTDNPSFETIVAQRYSRRHAILGGFGATAAAFFGLSACSDDNDKPVPAQVTAGSTGSANSGRVVTLNGAAASAGSTAWTQVSGPTVAISDAGAATARFIAPSVAATTPLVFRFTATDAQGRTSTADATVNVEPAALGFTAVPRSVADVVTVPAGYTVSVLYRMGDPLNGAVGPFANNGTDGNYAVRAGDQHDGMHYFGLAATGNGRDDSSNARGLLVMNHENIVQRYLHPNGPTGTAVGQSRPEAEAIKEIEAHGVSAVEVVRSSSGWTYVQTSALNRRITPNTPMVFSGPVAGTSYLQTAYSPAGAAGRGTINNCAAGLMPWATYTTCEENWAGYFRRDTGDNAARGGATAKAVVSLNRYGVTEGARGNFGWSTVTPANPADTTFSRWNITQGAGAATADFRNEANQYGWVVEIDPYDPNSIPRKRTALGRRANENLAPSHMIAGRRPAFYMGDDSRNEYIYKFLSSAPWVPADAQAANRLAMGDKYLDAGTLYVARFNADGSGQWLPLVFGQGPLTAANPGYAFADQADVLINTRLAADALAATRMDRPEWIAVNPKNGEVYVTLTNTNAASRPVSATDAANPRHYNDPKGASAQYGNPNGHIVRLRETGDTSEATSFTWDIYLFGAGADLDPNNINLSGLTAENDFSSPDGAFFARPTSIGGQNSPLLWVQTDDGAFTDVTNNQMLAALPGVVGDGAVRTITNTAQDGTSRTQATRVGKAPGVTLKRFLVGPKEAEITGIDQTPDGRTIFVNVQHPGEDTTTGFPNTFPSNWPASQTNPAAVSRPRSATIVITKDDGGVVGL